MMTILYEDDAVIVVWKPVGMESQSSRGFAADMVSEIQKHIHKDIHRVSPRSGAPYVGVIHRLDKPVSGVMVYAKEKKAAAALSKQVQEHQMTKKYRAVLCGKPVDNVENLVDYLLKDEKENVSRIVDKGINGAKRAELICRVLESQEVEPYGCLTLAEIELKTGRHHQIRVQMAGHGTPLWGDNRYNPMFGGTCGARGVRGAKDGADDKGGRGRTTAVSCENVALSAFQLTFFHPVTGRPMTFERLPDGAIFRRFQTGNPC
ncbi:MAG: RluA family pseudouridine synthase [Lachnospiraceae bacterium]|nr:RluA family pseudouridine synthase [Lachnospiraceae bacterium]